MKIDAQLTPGRLTINNLVLIRAFQTTTPEHVVEVVLDRIEEIRDFLAGLVVNDDETVPEFVGTLS